MLARELNKRNSMGEIILVQVVMVTINQPAAIQQQVYKDQKRPPLMLQIDIPLLCSHVVKIRFIRAFSF